MKAVILAGGLGTRLSEETHLKPKPMIEIGGMPILWHIMKIYSAYSIHDFIICCGYKGYLIKEFFSNYLRHISDITVDLTKNSIEVHHAEKEPWRITLVDTGENTMTGGRLNRVRSLVESETFLFTYGDGVADVDINSLLSHHKKHGRIATVTAVQPPGRFGALNIQPDTLVSGFNEKPLGDGSWISGGYFVLEPQVFDYLGDDDTVWEQGPLQALSSYGQLTAFKHHGFWQPMDTLRDVRFLEAEWSSGNPRWKIWS